MKVVILAGGLGTRLSEETELKPKPMVEIGFRPILWHIMKIYSSYGFNDFVICTGYKSWLIKEFFHHYYLHLADVTFDLGNNSVEYHHSHAEPWRVTLVDTGMQTMTGGRLARVRKYLDNEPFFMTYGDGVGNVDIRALLDFHKKSGRLATVSAAQPAGKFGALVIERDQVTSFREKPLGDDAWINAGFFVLEPGIFEYIQGGDATVWEREPLENIARDGQLGAYRHTGFWKPMDTIRDKIELETLWNSGRAPWKIWE
ncbi:MAG: glucose-1-phosphate cytidylyltransferase [Spirochaetota bacterium]|jgi:glucose-1-phosphate cytidylyltransferase|nr:glucose-1-phosphate cytidylyltransferase [Spirochaetota bacterium]